MTPDSQPQPKSWVRLLALFSIASLVETSFGGQVFAFTPLYLPKLGVAPADVAVWTGAVTSFSFVAGIPFLPFWGALADRYSRKPIIVRSYVVYLIAALITFAAGNVLVFALGRAVISFTLGNSGLMLATLNEHVPPRRVGLAFAIMNGALVFGAFLGPLVGGPIVDALGFPVLLLIDALLLLAVILALTFGYQDSYAGTQTEPLLRMALESLRFTWRLTRVRHLMAGQLLLWTGAGLGYTYLPLVVTSLYRGSDPGAAVGLVFGASGLATLLLAPLLGALADRFGHWRVLLFGALTLSVLYLTPALVNNVLALALLWALLYGVFSGVSSLSFNVLSSSVPAGVRGRIMSFSYLPTSLGFVIGPPIGSALAQANLFSIFPAGGVVTALSVVVFVFVYRKSRRMVAA